MRLVNWMTLKKGNHSKHSHSDTFISYWQEVNEFCFDYARYKEEKSRLSELQSCSLKRLEYLKKANVYNDAFHIWHDGPFGTINGSLFILCPFFIWSGLRLGKLPGQPVEWSEINAAWGLAVQLLHLLSIKMKVSFTQYTDAFLHASCISLGTNLFHLEASQGSRKLAKTRPLMNCTSSIIFFIDLIIN